MRVMTRAGQYLTVPDEQIVRQEKHITRFETYYLVTLTDGRQLALRTPIGKVKHTVVDMRATVREE